MTLIECYEFDYRAFNAILNFDCCPPNLINLRMSLEERYKDLENARHEKFKIGNVYYYPYDLFPKKVQYTAQAELIVIYECSAYLKKRKDFYVHKLAQRIMLTFQTTRIKKLNLSPDSVIQNIIMDDKQVLFISRSAKIKHKNQNAWQSDIVDIKSFSLQLI